MSGPTAPEGPPREPPGATWWIGAALVVLCGAAARVAGAGGDLWLDEIWSLEMARAVPSPGAVFTALHIDNNHHLNTLYLMAVGPDGSGLAYRALAVTAGAAMLVVAALAWAWRDRVLGMAWLVLLAGSYLLVHYASEARGFSLALLAAVACFAALDRMLRAGGLAWGVAFASGAVLGLLSHLTFLYALLAFGAWAGAVLLRSRGKGPRWTLHALAFGPPLLALAALWVVDLRLMIVGGGPAYRIPDVLVELLRSALNLPRGPAAWLVLPALAVAAWEVARMARNGEPEWVFHAVVMVAGPAAVLALTRPQYLAPRYFLVAVPFLLLLLARFLARTFRVGKVWAGVAATLLALFLAGGAIRLPRLLRDGRGQYQEAIRLIAAKEQEPVATVGGDNDFRNGMVLAWHAPRAGAARPLTYVPSGEWGAGAPRWVLLHRFEGEATPDRVGEGPNGRHYEHVATFPYAGLSGWNWYVYRMVEAEPAP